MAKAAAKKATGRPPKETPLSMHVGMKMTAEDRELVQRAADKARRTVSDWSRLRLVRVAKEELGIPLSEVDKIG